jgi:DNA-directed RNA polymerase sigma subunit (sigma70/sigma32)
MTDFAVKITVRSARLLRAMKAAGYKSQAELARAMGVSINHINGYFTFRLSPLANGDWSSLAMDISSMLHVEPEDLWPEHLRHVRMKKNSREISMTADEVQAIAAPKEFEIDRVGLGRMLGQLAPRERKVLELRYGLDGGGERTFAEIAEEFDRSEERIRQIEAKALRRLKHRSRKLDIMPE